MHTSGMRLRFLAGAAGLLFVLASDLPYPGDLLPKARAQAAEFSSQETLATLLQKGELTLVENRPDGKLKQVTAIAVIHRPAQEVWTRLLDYSSFVSWMPKVKESSIVRQQGNTTDVQWEIEVPGPNYRYMARNTPDPATLTLTQQQVSGALKGSRWSWQLVSQSPETTLVFRTVSTNVTDESWIARQIDDESHTLSYGINVTSSLLEVRALRRVMEQPKSEQPKSEQPKSQ